jgi:hypothetical protein
MQLLGLFNSQKQKMREKSGCGARFVSRFTKIGIPPIKHPSLKWSYSEETDGAVEIGIKLLSDSQLFRDCIEMGLTGATDIAEETGYSNGQVSKLAKKAMQASWLVKESREYRLASNRIWPVHHPSTL